MAKILEEVLITIARQALALREAGVVGRVTVGEVSFDLAGAEPPPVALPQPADDGQGNPLDDPDTYGGQVPRRRGADQPDKDDEE